MNERNIAYIEHEIVNQILIAEMCFEICNSHEVIPGLGNHFFPFFYNLCFGKGVLVLNSLLVSTESNELSIANYLKRNPNVLFKKETSKVRKQFKDVACLNSMKNKLSLRNKVVAHLDMNFRHSDFTSAYVLPSEINKYFEITKDLKTLVCNQFNYNPIDKPFEEIKNFSITTILDSLNNKDPEINLG